MALYAAGRCLLKSLRSAKGLSQRDLAALVDIPQSTVSNHERRNYLMTVEDARSYCRVLDCSLDDLYEWKRVNR